MSIQPKWRRLGFITLLVTSLFSLSACLEKSGNGSVTASCETEGFTSHIVFLVSSDTALPAVLSGQVNDTVAFDECAGSDSYLYSIERTGANYAQVNIWLPPTAKVYDQYFDLNNEPLPNPTITYKIFARDYCDSDAVIMSRGDTTLNWQPLYTSNSSCPNAGYSAVVR